MATAGLSHSGRDGDVVARVGFLRMEGRDAVGVAVHDAAHAEGGPLQLVDMVEVQSQKCSGKPVLRVSSSQGLLVQPCVASRWVCGWWLRRVLAGATDGARLC